MKVRELKEQRKLFRKSIVSTNSQKIWKNSSKGAKSVYSSTGIGSGIWPRGNVNE